MYRSSVILLLALGLLASPTSTTLSWRPSSDPGPAVTAPPKTEVNEVKETIHGVEIVDSYRWLEDQTSPKTRAWIDAENAYTDSLLSRIPGRDTLKDKVAALLKIEAMSVPRVRNGRYFFTRRQPDQDQSSLYMRQGPTGKDEVLVDPLALSPTHSITVGLEDISNDGSLVVYNLRHGGEDEVTLHLFDVNAHKDLPDQFPRALYGGITLLLDKSGFYYEKTTAQGPRLYLHKIGSPTTEDVEIFGKGYGPGTFINDYLTDDNHYLVIMVSHARPL
jgi:prolyl oligopeptidase